MLWIAEQKRSACTLSIRCLRPAPRAGRSVNGSQETKASQRAANPRAIFRGCPCTKGTKGGFASGQRACYSRFLAAFPGTGEAPAYAVFHGIGQQARHFPTQGPLFEASCKYAFSWFEFRARAKPPSLFAAWPQETKKRTAMKWHAQAPNKPAFALFRLAEMGLAP